MTTIDANKFLNEQITRLNLHDIKPNIWVNETKEVVRRVFPITFDEKNKKLSAGSFYPYFYQSVYVATELESAEQKSKNEIEHANAMKQGKVYVTDLINSWIRDIDRFGLEQSPNLQQTLQPNHVTKQLGRTWPDIFHVELLNGNLKNWAVWLIVIAIVLGLFIYVLSYFVPLHIELYKGRFGSPTGSLILCNKFSEQ